MYIIPLNKEKAKQIDETWQKRTDRACRRALHAELRKLPDSINDVPLEAFRFIVREAAGRAVRYSEENEYLAELHPVDPSTSTDGGEPIYQAIDLAKTRGELFRILTDTYLAQDIVGKFTDGSDVRAVSKLWALDIEAIEKPIRAEWDEKKRVSYEKRDARLEAERKRAAAEKKPKKEAKKAKAKKR